MGVLVRTIAVFALGGCLVSGAVAAQRGTIPPQTVAAQEEAYRQHGLRAAGAVIWRLLIAPAGPSRTKPPGVKLPTSPISTSGSPSIGSRAARVVVVEFSDFQCPFCARFANETWPELKAKFVDSGQVRVVFKNVPLGIHPRAKPAATAAMCAEVQGMFWPFHDAIFKTPGDLGDAHLASVAADVGVNRTSFASCMTGTIARIGADADLAASLGIAGTPTFIVGRANGDSVVPVSIMTGAKKTADFESAIRAVSFK